MAGQIGGGREGAHLAGSQQGGSWSISPGFEQFSIAHETIEALREIGLLDEIIVTKEEVVVYPAGRETGL